MDISLHEWVDGVNVSHTSCIGTTKKYGLVKSIQNDILILCINVIMKSLPNENHLFSHWFIVQHINDDFDPNWKFRGLEG